MNTEEITTHAKALARLWLAGQHKQATLEMFSDKFEPWNAAAIAARAAVEVARQNREAAQAFAVFLAVHAAEG